MFTDPDGFESVDDSAGIDSAAGALEGACQSRRLSVPVGAPCSPTDVGRIRTKVKVVAALHVYQWTRRAMGERKSTATGLPGMVNALCLASVAESVD